MIREKIRLLKKVVRPGCEKYIDTEKVFLSDNSQEKRKYNSINIIFFDYFVEQMEKIEFQN